MQYSSSNGGGETKEVLKRTNFLGQTGVQRAISTHPQAKDVTPLQGRATLDQWHQKRGGGYVGGDTSKAV